ncbi:hypothetical protein [Dyadobacter sp. CY326]|uniref:hypothetical protein n=1 Tax=Dyadobacter sp. CY326 TaxID=2907300 RepID=UPI001F19E849|nr:hypothetical protein [Dyadobacter sp. CY326]MCE7066127.1 hypothetical protein [Dyadobacter sp. CY326]
MSIDVLVKVAMLIGLFVSYNLWLHFFPITKTAFYDNIERTEEYLFSGKNYTHVFVGSGLIGGFQNNALKHSFKLFFPYYGSCTGIEIIALSQKIPDVLLVETNYIFKGINQELIEKVFAKHAELKRFLPFLLKKNQPLNLLKSLIKRVLGKNKERDADLGEKNEQALTMFINLYNELPNVDKFRSDIERLKSNIDLIVSRGCQVIFFESPMDPVLENASLFAFQRDVLKIVFSPGQFRWIAPDLLEKYETEDGIHLTVGSSQKFAGYIVRQITENIV